MNDIADQTDAPGSTAREARALFRLGLPLVGSHIAQMLIVTTDTMMMGWYNVTSLAALSLSGPVWYIFFVLGSGFAWAVMPMVANASANDDATQVRRVTRMALWLSIIFGLLSLPIFFFFHDIYLAIGQQPEVAERGGLYISFLGVAMIPALLVMVMKSYLSALELTRSILVVTIAGAFLNAGLNYALIFGNLGAPELGIAGAGIASILGNLFAFVALAIHANRKMPEHDLFRNLHRPDWESLGDVFRLGLPIGLTTFAEVGLFACAGILMGWVGTIALAAHGVALQIASITFMIPMGLSQAVTVRIGQAWKKPDGAFRIRRTAQVGMFMVLVSASLTILLFLTIPHILSGLFIGPDEPDRPAAIAAASALLAIAAMFQFVDAAQVMALGMLRGVQDTRVPMLMASISYWAIGLPISYVLAFPMDLGASGVWLGLTAGLASAAVLLQFRFWTGPALRPV